MLPLGGKNERKKARIKEGKKGKEERKEAEKKEALFLFNLPVETGELSLGRRAVWGGGGRGAETPARHL